jgi:general secretion pathway protein I
MRTLESPRDRGFTLVEVLVGLAVFSIGVMALFHARGESARSIGALEERALAQIVAENRLIETLALGAPPVIGTSEGEVALADRNWRWSEEIAETPDVALRRIVVTVRGAAEDSVLAEVTGFGGVN